MALFLSEEDVGYGVNAADLSLSAEPCARVRCSSLSLLFLSFLLLTRSYIADRRAARTSGVGDSTHEKSPGRERGGKGSVTIDIQVPGRVIISAVMNRLDVRGSVVREALCRDCMTRS
jgi:hypothetical protein